MTWLEEDNRARPPRRPDPQRRQHDLLHEPGAVVGDALTAGMKREDERTRAAGRVVAGTDTP